MQLYLRFLRYLRPYRLLAVAASLSFIISGFLGAYPIQLFKRAVDVAVGDALSATRWDRQPRKGDLHLARRAIHPVYAWRWVACSSRNPTSRKN